MFFKSGILEMQNADILHELIESKPILKVMGAFDSMSAKLVKKNLHICNTQLRGEIIT